ncbi:kinase-like domain-containing protein, partial [Cercophora newfieldiana]
AKSYRKILAILILIGKADTILDFVQHSVADAQLPLEKLGIGQPEPGVCRPFQLGLWGKGEPARPFKRWEHRDIEEFENKQWETLAPFFSRASKEDNNLVRHYELSWRRPLPFEILEGTGISKGTYRATSGGTTGSDSSLDSMKGGHGKVWKVRINREHHDLQSYRNGNEQNPALAIKRLLSADKKAFKNEVNILTRLNKCNDPHLVKLLLTMEIIGRPGKDNSFFLIFPLADSNLRQFWKNRFPHPKGTITASYVRWVSKQFHGLAVALCKLHNLRPTNASSVDQEKPKASADGDPFYGIHGDIKPENLLWYQEWVGPPGTRTDDDCKDAFGVLQLADFGISRLHHTETRSNATMGRATKTYAPPEVEWAFDRCSRSFDIWGLGCVFLEFMCWLVQGGSGETNPVDDFHEARYLGRKNRSLEGTIQDTFYHVVKDKDSTKFKVNPAVEELILNMRKGASPFVIDILNVILYDMLVVEPKKTSLKPGQKEPDNLPLATSDGKRQRITCIELAKKLEPMAKHNDSYFTNPSSRARESIRRSPQTLTVHESAGELVKRRSMTRSFSIENTKEEDTKHDKQRRMTAILKSFRGNE